MPRCLGLMLAVLGLAGGLCAQDSAASLRGTLVDATGETIPGATARLRGPAGELIATTNEAGEYRFDGLASGEYQLTAVYPGFSTSELRGINLAVIGSKELPPLPLIVGSCLSASVEYFQLLEGAGRSGVLTGDVTEYVADARDRDPIPLQGVSVIALCGDGRVCGNWITDVDGHFRVAGLEDGFYSLKFQKEGYLQQSLASWPVQRGLETVVRESIGKCPDAKCLQPPEVVIICQ